MQRTRFGPVFPERTLMKIKHLVLATLVALSGFATLASAAPVGHKVCHWSKVHPHHKVCHWVH